MKTISLTALTMLLSAASIALAQLNYVEGELLIKFDGGPQGLAAETAKQAFKHQVKRNFDQIGWQHIRLPAGMSTKEGIAEYKKLPGVVAIDANYAGVRVPPLPTAAVENVNAVNGVGTPPADPLFNQQWALANIGVTNAWSVSTGDGQVVVAVIDTGINYHHEDLRDNVWRNLDEIAGNGIDDDSNGYVDDIYGIDTSNDSDPFDEGEIVNGVPFYHGTACAGIIGAIGNNGKGLSGINWAVKIMGLRAGAIVTVADTLEAFNYVLLMKRRGVNLRVVSMSFNVVFHQALLEAHQAMASEGLLQVGIAQNQSSDIDRNPIYPAAYNISNLLIVAASDQFDGLASFSGYGRTNVDLAAPGVNVTTTFGPNPTNYLNVFNGTSASCPMVVGAAALLAAANPAATAEDLKIAIMETVDLLPAFTNKMVSHGRLNVGRAMQHPKIVTNTRPYINSQPANVTAKQSSNATFTVWVNGRTLEYQWYHNGLTLAYGSGASLILTNVTSQQAGNYYAVISNPLGAVTSAVAVLTVLVPPRIVTPAAPLHIEVVLGEQVTLGVQTIGTLPVAYRWRRIAPNGSGANLTNISVNSQDVCFFTFTAGANSAGTYTVVLTNVAQPSSGTQITNAFVTILPDTDGDRMPDLWESSYQLDANLNDAAFDSDGDGSSNLDEYLARTDPRDPQSLLKLNATMAGISFRSVSNQTYTIQSSKDLLQWSRFADVVALGSDHTPHFNPQLATNAFYRLVTPRQP